MEPAMSEFAAAYAAHVAGRLEEAERGYRAVLATEPGHADAWHLLGVAAQQRGQAALAVEHIKRALTLGGAQSSYLTNLGIALQATGRHDEAVAALEQASALDPGSFAAHFALGNALKSRGRPEDAVSSYQRALNLQPDNASAYNNLGSAVQSLGRLTEAAAHFRKAAALQPTHAKAHYNLGTVLKNAGKLEDAAAGFRRALALAPDMAEAHINLGAVLHDQGHLDDAIVHARKAIALNPNDAAAFNNLGAALRDLGQFDAAMESYAKALALRPTLAEAQHNQGVALQIAGREDEALERFQSAQDLNPEFAEAEQNAALLMLMSGDFKSGWDAYECRWRRNVPALGLRAFAYPRWEGEAGDGAVLVWGEQGVGDKVLYASMIPSLLSRGHRVVMETDQRLTGLFERSFPGVQAVAKQNPPHEATGRSDIRWQIPLASLGRWFRRDIASFPASSAYLRADDQRRSHYRQLLEENSNGRRIVGISWISRAARIGQHKTLNLGDWAPILQIPGVLFVDLQYGDTAAEREAVERELGVPILHLADLDLRDDLEGVAALASACDLVISVSSTIVHLAAALGRPTWVLVPAGAGNLWYWMREADHTPWYPSVTIFRQSKFGRWQEVVERVTEKLRSAAGRDEAVTAN
jgi:tetratricopeptide (TPR) repeat protein